jgi:histone H1/5
MSDKGASTAVTAKAASVGGAKKGNAGKAAGPSKRSTGVKKTAAAAATHPKYSEMVRRALGELKERGGSSRQAVLKYVMQHFDVGKDENIVNKHVKIALRAGVQDASLKQSKGARGATGSFRLGEAAVEKKKKPQKKAAESVKKVAKPKKAASSKKSAAKPVVRQGAKKTTTGEKVKVDKPTKVKTAAPKAKKAVKSDSPKKAAVNKAAPKKAVKSDKPKKVKVVKKASASGKKAAVKTASS